MHPVCAFRRNKLQILEDYFQAGYGIAFRRKALFSLGRCSLRTWFDARADWVQCFPTLDRGWAPPESGRRGWCSLTLSTIAKRRSFDCAQEWKGWGTHTQKVVAGKRVGRPLVRVRIRRKISFGDENRLRKKALADGNSSIGFCRG
jgi:hypothetical protein